MTENEKLFKALKIIKEICAEQVDCADCPLRKEGGCAMWREMPCHWDIKEPPKPIEYRPFGE